VIFLYLEDLRRLGSRLFGGSRPDMDRAAAVGDD
jgi:hypothetical protein